jgi:hypothetical protein
MTNVAADPAYTQTRAALEKRLLDVLTEQHDPRLMEQPCRYAQPSPAQHSAAQHIDIDIDIDMQLKCGWPPMKVRAGAVRCAVVNAGCYRSEGWDNI